MCVCVLPIYSGHQVRWMYQPGSHRRKVTQDFSSTFLLRCMSLFIYLFNLCERGATTRGCSGGRGSDDTRGYEVGSGDVGKELPRGWSRKSVSLWGGPTRSIPRNWFIGCQSSEIP